MKRTREIITGILIGSFIGVFYAPQLAAYLPLILIAGVVLFLKVVLEKQVTFKSAKKNANFVLTEEKFCGKISPTKRTQGMFYFNSFNFFNGKISKYHLIGVLIGLVIGSYLKFRLGIRQKQDEAL